MSDRNYHRFYGLLKGMPGDREDMKETLVSSYTGGRTTHLGEMTQREYDAMCASLEKRTGRREELRKARSVCLRLLQKIGVDTTEWSAVNSYCMSPRIAGKVFRDLSTGELDDLSVKLRMILKKQNDK